jgi:hypothetical protein
MNLRLLVSGLGAWPLEQSGMGKTGIVEVVAIVFQYQYGSDPRSLRFAIKRVENGVV